MPSSNTPAADSIPPGSPHPIRSGPILVYGLASVVAMWCAWLLTHIPGLSTDPRAVTLSLVGTLALVTCLAGWSVARGGAARIGWQVGAGAGGLASAINLLILASYLVEQAKPGSKPAEGMSGLSPSALIYIPGFLLGGVVVGALFAAIGAAGGKKPAPADGRYAGHDHWLARLSLVTVVAILPLIVLGGFVTSTASGMAVPGWPDSYGANMFLFPISLMSHPRVFLEHSHRLFGAMVGITVLTLLIYTLKVETRRWVRNWVIAMFVAVCLQGLLGGLRVVQNSPVLAMVHGIFAQLFFAMSAAAAMYFTRAYRLLKLSAPPTDLPADDASGARKRRIMATALLHILMLQLIMGAWYRHTGMLHPLYTHMALAVVIVFIGFVGGLMFRSIADLPPDAARLSRTVGAGMLACLFLQFVLGWGAFVLVLQGPKKGDTPLSHQLDSAPPPPPAQTIIATAHQANGALLIGLAAAGTVLARGAMRRR